MTRDADIRYMQTQDGVQSAVARFTLAVDRRYKKDGEQSADFISCVCFGKTAEFIEKYVVQGTKLIVDGRITTGKYTNKNGVTVYTTDVTVENCEFAESKKTQDGNSTQNNNAAPNNPGDGFISVSDNVDDDFLPFH